MEKFLEEYYEKFLSKALFSNFERIQSKVNSVRTRKVK